MLDSLELWQEVYDTAERPSIKQTAFQHVHDLRVLIDLDGLRKAIKLYYEKHQQLPTNLNDLVSARIVKQVPLDPEGNAYQYDPGAGKVKYSKQLNIYRRYQEG